MTSADPRTPADVATGQVPPGPASPPRYQESPLRQVFPGWKYPPALERQDRGYFDRYRAYIGQLPEPGNDPDNYSAAVLTASQRIYDGEATRRESINNRCGAVLSTGGILGALFVAAGQLGLSRAKGSLGSAAWAELVIFVIALVFLGFSISMALAVQGSQQGNVIDPGDLRTGDGQPVLSSYSLHLARKYLEYTVDNYATNNKLKFRLHSAQRHLRNAIIAIIVAGILSPLALHSTTATSVGAAPPTAIREA